MLSRPPPRAAEAWRTAEKLKDAAELAAAPLGRGAARPARWLFGKQKYRDGYLMSGFVFSINYACMGAITSIAGEFATIVGVVRHHFPALRGSVGGTGDADPQVLQACTRTCGRRVTGITRSRASVLADFCVSRSPATGTCFNCLLLAIWYC